MTFSGNQLYAKNEKIIMQKLKAKTKASLHSLSYKIQNVCKSKVHNSTLAAYFNNTHAQIFLEDYICYICNLLVGHASRNSMYLE